MTEHPAAATTDDVQDQRFHPVWCDPERCTWSDNGGAHHSAWVTLGPLPKSRIVVRAYLYSMGDATAAPLVMLAFHAPIDHPDDIADHAGLDENTVTHAVLDPDQVLQLTDLLT